MHALGSANYRRQQFFEDNNVPFHYKDEAVHSADVVNKSVLAIAVIVTFLLTLALYSTVLLTVGCICWLKRKPSST